MFHAGPQSEQEAKAGSQSCRSRGRLRGGEFTQYDDVHRESRHLYGLEGFAIPERQQRLFEECWRMDENKSSQIRTFYLI